MNVDALDIIAAGIILFLAGIAQSAVGFGYALFSTPLLIWIGIPLPNAITLVMTCAMMQSSMAARKLHATVPWRLALTATTTRLIFVVLGLFLLKKLAVLRPDQIRMVIGCILCALVAIQILWRPQPVQSMHWGWAGLAFSISGLLGGLCGMGGPPLVVWLMAHDWSTQKTRGFLFAVFATSIPVQIGLLCLTFGANILWNVAIGIAFLPLVYLGTRMGLPLGNRMAKNTLRRVAYALLLLIGISSVLPTLWASLQ